MIGEREPRFPPDPRDEIGDAHLMLEHHERHQVAVRRELRAGIQEPAQVGHVRAGLGVERACRSVAIWLPM